jgi:serine-type D-Ala-D-Ala carboxypeptidase (penicillin-binding protein 5/6)
VSLAPFPFVLMMGLALLAMGALTAAATVVVEPTVGETDLFATAAGVPPVPAAAYLVIDADTGEPLAAVDADERRPVGSLVKLMTARLALRAGAPDHPVTVPQLDVGGDESQVGLVPGEVEARGTLIAATLVASANDAAGALAVDVGGDQTRFVAMMNEEAAALGLDDTRYSDPSGLGGDQWSTAHDVAVLADLQMDDPAFRAVVDDPDVTVDARSHATTNDLLGAYAGVDGVKTGHTEDAGWCLAASAERDGRRVIVVVLGAPTEQARDAAVTSLLDWALAPATEVTPGVAPGGSSQ